MLSHCWRNGNLTFLDPSDAPLALPVTVPRQLTR